MAQSAGEGYCRKATKRASVTDPDVAQKLALDLKQPKMLRFFGVLEIRMKKFLVVFAVLAVLIFVISCGGGSKTNDTTGTGDTVTDEDAVGDTVTDEDAVIQFRRTFPNAVRQARLRAMIRQANLFGQKKQMSPWIIMMLDLIAKVIAKPD